MIFDVKVYRLRFKPHTRNFFTLLMLACLGLTAGLTACTTSTVSSDKVDYKSGGTQRGPNLAYPPDLVTTQADRRYLVQDGSATMSDYNAILKKGGEVRKTPLTGIPGMRMVRDGERRWLVIDKPAAELYPQIKDFWQENGFLLLVDSPTTGIIETDWVENRAKIPQDYLRSLLGGVLSSVFDTGERDKYKTRLEVLKPDQTEIFITHKGASEEPVRDNSGGVISTKWVPRPNDPDLDAAFLVRLMERLGHTQEQAKAQLAAASSPTNKVVKAKLAQDSSGVAVIELPSSFDRAWRDVGLALDRSNFTVIDRDRSKGVYFVRYVNTKDTGDASKGFFSGLFSSKDEAALQAKQYRIFVKANGAEASQVFAQDAEGKPENSPAGIQLLTLLAEQLAR